MGKQTVQEIVVSQETREALQSQGIDHLILDADVLIEAGKNRQEFSEFFQLIKDLGIALTTIEPVILECMNNGNGLKDILKIKNYVESTVSVPLFVKPMEVQGNRQTLIDNILLSVSSNEARKLSFPDYLLIKALRDYGKKVALITGNHVDFPTAILERLGFVEVCLANPTQVWPLGIYCFSEKKYAKAALKLLDD